MSGSYLLHTHKANLAIQRLSFLIWALKSVRELWSLLLFCIFIKNV